MEAPRVAPPVVCVLAPLAARPPPQPAAVRHCWLRRPEPINLSPLHASLSHRIRQPGAAAAAAVAAERPLPSPSHRRRRSALPRLIKRRSNRPLDKQRAPAPVSAPRWLHQVRCWPASPAPRRLRQEYLPAAPTSPAARALPQRWDGYAVSVTASRQLRYVCHL